MEFETDYYKEDLINLNVYSENNNIYYYFDGMYDKYIKYDINTLTKEINVDLTKEEDYKIIMESVKTALEINLKDEYFTKEKVKIDNKSIIKNTMILDENTSIKFEENFYNYLLKDNSFIQSYASIKNIDEKELKEEIQDYLDILKEEPYNLTISLYNDYSNFIKLEIIYNDQKIYITKKNNNKYEFMYEGKDEYIGSIDIEKGKNKKEIKFKIKDSLSRNIMNIKVTIVIGDDIKIERKDMSNSINANEISEEALEVMSNSLMGNQGFIKLIQDLLETEYGNILNNIA